MSGTPPAAHPHLGGRIRFCVSCGAELSYRPWGEGDGSMQLCCSRPGCGHVHFLDPKLAAGVILAREGKALLVQRRHNPGKGLWTFPGGFVNRGEVVAEAAAREALEETGVEARMGPLLGVYSLPGNPIVLVAYLGEIAGGEPRPLDETEAVKFAAPEEIDPAELAFDTTRAALEDWRAWMREGRIPRGHPARGGR
ncbi:MAG: NUDIX hydrolase [Candidatus Tectomicrobia bacterium]|uniref:NUDIX hydrolase n=1 Tax=Tectimicrobiota bacterium TaxID=2528274 RepID=A0A932I2N2_UNCTE|nr:NUDIX hydrolase [Candidatus Tectomicrobia bacterium]